jgi:hypothetical protein
VTSAYFEAGSRPTVISGDTYRSFDFKSVEAFFRIGVGITAIILVIVASDIDWAMERPKPVTV